LVFLQFFCCLLQFFEFLLGVDTKFKPFEVNERLVCFTDLFVEISDSLIDQVKVVAFENFGGVDACEHLGDSFASLFLPLLQHLDVFLYL
jgi:hypothetical protein